MTRGGIYPAVRWGISRDAADGNSERTQRRTDSSEPAAGKVRLFLFALCPDIPGWMCLHTVGIDVNKLNFPGD